MAPSPFRRRKAAKAVRNLAIAEAALALAKDRALAAAPGRHKSRRPSGKLLLLGGAVAAAGAAALLKRDKVAGLLPSRAGEPEPERCRSAGSWGRPSALYPWNCMTRSLRENCRY